MAGYAFGDSALAARRLGLLAQVFEPTSRSFLAAVAHLADPAGALAGWSTQLAPGGLLLVEEVERIRTGQPALGGYLEVAAALLAARGHALEICPRLHRLPDPPGRP